MNWLLIGVVILLIGFAFKGGHDGFIKTAFSIFSVILSVAIAAVISPYVSKLFQQNEKIIEFTADKVTKSLALTAGKDVKGEEEQLKTIEDLHLPKSLKNSLVENNNSEVYKALTVKKFSDYISQYLTVVILNAVSFLIVLVAVKIALYILARVLDLLSKLPIINGLNKTAGLFIGIFHGLIILWILCIVLTACSGTATGKAFYVYINNSWFLSSIYNNNLLLQTVTNIAKVLF